MKTKDSISFSRFFISETQPSSGWSIGPHIITSQSFCPNFSHTRYKAKNNSLLWPIGVMCGPVLQLEQGCVSEIKKNCWNWWSPFIGLNWLVSVGCYTNYFLRSKTLLTSNNLLLITLSAWRWCWMYFWKFIKKCCKNYDTATQGYSVERNVSTILLHHHSYISNYREVVALQF